MTPRHLKLLVLLLPLFIVRGMLPIGFMMSFEEGAPRIVFCPGQITISGAPAGSEPQRLHQGHEHHHSGDQSEPSSTEYSHQTCPFAFAAAAPLTASAEFAAEPPSSEAIVSPPDSAIVVVAYRAHPIRGPPALS